MKISIDPIHDASGVPRHPLVALASHIKLRELAAALRHANHSTVAVYVSRARKRKGLLVPPDWAYPLACLAAIRGLPAIYCRPASYRPDLYDPKWEC